jgi:hypothetical protein
LTHARSENERVRARVDEDRDDTGRHASERASASSSSSSSSTTSSRRNKCVVDVSKRMR